MSPKRDVGPEIIAQMHERSQCIGQLEALAAVAVYYSLAGELRGRRVVHYIDNSSAMASLVKGASSEVDSSSIVHAFWALASELEIDVWFDYVRSAANIADWPSRGQLGELQDDIGSRRLADVAMPDIGSWTDPDAAVRRARLAPLEDGLSPPIKRRCRR